MRHRTMLCVASVTFLLVGCNQPAVTPKAFAFQSSENTIRDWNDVAREIASGMAARSLLPSQGQPGAPITTTPPKPIFVRVQAPDSAFVREVADELESDILGAGGTVARSPAGATVVNLDVNFVRWGPRDKPPGLLGTASGLLAVPAIVTSASAPLSTWAAADAASYAAVGVGVLADLAIAITPTMNAEAVWAATIVTDDQVVMKLEKPIYIRADDIPLYAKSASLSPMPSWSDIPPLRMRTIRYDP
jgi:hypothetical protein